MIPEPIKEVIQLEDGRTISIETGKLAKQADGSVVVRMGNTMLLATAVASKDVNPDINFMPLTVDYREKFAAAGKFPGGFFKREGRPSTEEILVMRLVDRVLRPLFPKDYHAETQVMIQLMSHDENVQADALAGLAASAALSISDIPFAGPISEVRVAKIDGELVINPSLAQCENATIDLMVGGTQDSVTMVEGQMEEVSEEEMIEAIEFAQQAIIKQVGIQKELISKIAKAFPKREYPTADQDEALCKQIEEATYDKLYAIAKEGLGKQERSEKFGLVKEELLATFSEEDLEEKGKMIGEYFHSAMKKAVRDLTLKEGLRLDGRKTTEIRPIWTETDYLPSVHGSALFTRGETQALASVTLGTSREVNMIDGATLRSEESFYLHYNFPPFSTGEARPLRGTSRREIGHGHLAQRALEPMIPEDAPYTIRIVSEILESNGSSSMATVCAGSMALMDAGIQMMKPVSGIAMGLIYDEESKDYAVLSDILGDEDHLGDMDFKVTGTKDGITACQMDIKIKDLKREILEKALHQAKEGRLHIMGEMEKSITEARPQVKDFVPKMVKVEIAKDYIGAVIGKGGKDIQQLQEDTDTTIVIEEVDGKGIIEIMGTDMDKIQKVLDRLDVITFEPVVGEIYEGPVTSIKDFGAFIEIAPGTEGLLHISEIAWRRLNKVTEELKEGDIVKVKLLGMDRGRMKLSRKVLLPRPPRNDKKEENK